MPAPPRDTPTATTRPLGFRLLRYFSYASLVAFSVVMATVYALQRGEEAFFARTQDEQTAFIAQMEEALGREHDRSAATALVSVHEAGHINLARLFANALAPGDLALFFAAAQGVPVEPCRASGLSKDARHACQAKLGAAFAALPGFAAIDRAARGRMKGTTIFKIKIFDLRGITVYSSEAAQIGEDKADNAGWQAAARGRAASELTHRDRFSAFEGVVENRDLISTYVPIEDPRSGRIAGVFEIYSDVTPFLAQIVAASARAKDIAADHHSAIDRSIRINRDRVEAKSNQFLGIVYGLFVLLFLVLLAIVRYGQRIIDQQALAREAAAVREQQRHSEKMAALATMAAGISHEVGNPLMIIAGLAQEIGSGARTDTPVQAHARQIVEQTSRIAVMTRQIADFAASRSDRTELVDVNDMIRGVCAFLGHDARLSGTRIVFEPGDSLPACIAIPEHLREVLMDLLPQIASGANGPAPAGTRVLVTTRAQDGGVRIALCRAAADGSGTLDPPALIGDGGLQRARERMAGMGGTLTASDNAVDLTLATAPPEPGPTSAPVPA